MFFRFSYFPRKICFYRNKKKCGYYFYIIRSHSSIFSLELVLNEMWITSVLNLFFYILNFLSAYRMFRYCIYTMTPTLKLFLILLLILSQILPIISISLFNSVCGNRMIRWNNKMKRNNGNKTILSNSNVTQGYGHAKKAKPFQFVICCFSYHC